MSHPTRRGENGSCCKTTEDGHRFGDARAAGQLQGRVSAHYRTASGGGTERGIEGCDIGAQNAKTKVSVEQCVEVSDFKILEQNKMFKFLH